MNKIVKHMRFFLFLSLSVCFLISCSEDLDIKSFEPETPVYSFEGEEVSATKDGGEYTVNVKSNLPWRAKSNTSWITLNSESGMTDGSISFTVARNRTVEQRVGEIIVWVTGDDEKRLRVVQAPSEPSDLINHYYVKVDGVDSNDGLSWTNATTLENALEIMAPGDNIHIAAGEYIPTQLVSGGSDNGDKTFEIHSNVVIIGGYPADAKEGDVSDPTVNETVLSGNYVSYHTVTVTAPNEADKKVVIKNLSIKNGRTGSSSSGTLNINGSVYRRSYGGGLIVGKSEVDLIGCTVSNNETQQHAAGIYLFDGAVVRFIDSDITNNKGILENSNGGGVFNESATLYLINCNVTGNSVWGVGGGLYSFSAGTPTYMYIYNTTVANNSTNAGPNTGRRGGGYYAREFSRAQIVNSTFYGNESGRGGGISVYGAVGREAYVDMISSTVTDNFVYNNAGGVEVLANTKFNAYNSIITGNRATTLPDMQWAANTATRAYSIVGSEVLDEADAVVSGQVFDFETMLGKPANNGGRGLTCKVDAASPAALLGMDAEKLGKLALEFSPAIDSEIITKDQAGNSRVGKSVMGAIAP